MDRRPIQKSKLDIHRLYRPIQSEDPISIGRWSGPFAHLCLFVTGAAKFIVPGRGIKLTRHHNSAGILEESMGAKNQVGMELSYQPARVGNLSPAIGTRIHVGIGLSNRPARLCSLATEFQTRFLELIPRPKAGLKFLTQRAEASLESIPGLIKSLRILSLSPETGSLHSRSFVVKTSFGHIPSNEQSKRDVFVTVILLIYNIFTIFYGPSQKI